MAQTSCRVDMPRCETSLRRFLKPDPNTNLDRTAKPIYGLRSSRAESHTRRRVSLVATRVSSSIPPRPLREAVANLYAVLRKFLLRALRWYRHGRVMHVLSSIANPWGLEFEQELDDVERQARAVDELAQSASRAELREAHFQIHEIRCELQAMTKIVEDGFQRMTQFALAPGEPNSTIKNVERPHFLQGDDPPRSTWPDS
ncbi:hypothetical protein F5Y12DRAFT_709613 [Xylaria sp. FL1777]|nr:hypothetical protein F5Y12DRAFT_709613 [Xylaria sp. FL1777]